MKLALFLTAAIAMFFGGCATKTFKLLNESDKPTRVVSDAKYNEEVDFEWKISKGDRVEIVVTIQTFGEPMVQFNPLVNAPNKMQAGSTKDGSEGIMVPKNGVISMPLIGSIKIDALTETEATEKLTKAYRQYIKNPFVTVKILNQKIFVLGEVRKPGVVPVLNGTVGLFEALAYSGDLTDAAERTKIKIIRGGLRSPELREIDLSNMSAIKLTSLILQPNDIVYVQPRTMKAYNVAFDEQVPFFRMIHSMLLPFVDFATMKKEGVINVFQ